MTWLAVRAWWSHRRRTPTPPVNLRATYPDGRTIPMECVYRGRHGGLDHWEVISPEMVWYEPGMRVRFDELPAGTNLAIPLRGDDTEAGWP